MSFFLSFLFVSLFPCPPHVNVKLMIYYFIGLVKKTNHGGVLDLDGYMMDTDPTDRSDVKVFESQKGGLPAFVPLSDMLGSS